MNIEEIDKRLFNLLYNQKVETADEALEANKKVLNYWNKLKRNRKVLLKALEVTKDTNGKKAVLGKTICDILLCEYKNVPKDIYNQLIKIIYNNIDIAREYLINENANDTFLTMTLWNSDLNLTKKQKDFAVNEAMNQIFTEKYYQIRDNIVSIINNSNILKDYIVTDIDFKNKNSQDNVDILYDIRYYILRNHNWNFDEKKSLVFKFYPKDEIYETLLNYWESKLINIFYQDFRLECSIEQLYNMTPEIILKLYQDNPDNGLDVIKDLELIKLLNIIRPKKEEDLDKSRRRIVS